MNLCIWAKYKIFIQHECNEQYRLQAGNVEISSTVLISVTRPLPSPLSEVDQAALILSNLGRPIGRNTCTWSQGISKQEFRFPYLNNEWMMILIFPHPLWQLQYITTKVTDRHCGFVKKKRFDGCIQSPLMSNNTECCRSVARAMLHMQDLPYVFVFWDFVETSGWLMDAFSLCYHIYSCHVEPFNNSLFTDVRKILPYCAFTVCFIT